MPETPALLTTCGLTKRYGGVVAVDGLDLTLAVGDSLGVIGPNGAGKSTLVGLISGAGTATAGTVWIAGRDVTDLGAAGRTRLGVGRTHQIPRPFSGMTALENLMLAGRHAQGVRESGRETAERCLGILERTGLGPDAATLGGRLPLLKRKRLELARALALRPRLLLLDEIGAGLVEHETAELITVIQQVKGEVEGLILIEHVMDVVTSCCERTVVLDFGKVIAEGTTREVLADPTVASVYLGTSSEHHGAPPQAVTSTTGTRRRPVTDPAEDPLLAVRELAVSYGGVRALRGVDIDVRPGEVVALLGANGAGKTTLANAVSGVVAPDTGTIEFAGESLVGQRPDQVTQGGIAHCMEGRRIFSTLTVEENLVLGAGAAPRAVVRERLAQIYDTFPVLAERRSHAGTAMSGGQQQMLAIGRALMTAPRLVIFDEISLGLAPVAVDTLYETLAGLRETGVAMLLVEQNLERGLGLADRAYVMAHGRIALSGEPDVIRNHPQLRSLYVGDAASDSTPRSENHHNEGTTP